MAALNNKLLNDMELHLEAQLSHPLKANYMKVVVAGMHAGLAGGDASLLASLRQSKDPIKSAAIGAINLVMILRKDSRGVMPINALVPGAFTLMLKALDFIDRMGLAKVGNEELAKATHIFTNHIFAALGITPQKLNAMADQVHGVMKDPTAMEKIKLKAGLVQHPMVAKPTPTGMINKEAPDGV